VTLVNSLRNLMEDEKKEDDAIENSNPVPT
jgi:hypothetical protein